MKTIIATIPKAGTYLAREILTKAGLICDPKHITQGSEVLDIAGDFCVGHPTFHNSPFKVVFIHRDLRDVLVSSIRYSMKIGKRETQEITSELLCQAIKDARLVPRMSSMMRWFFNADFYMTFNNLFNVRAVANLVSFVQEKPCSIMQARFLIDASVNKKTETWSGKDVRSDRKLYWTDKVEVLWRKTTHHRYNKTMRYE